MVFDKGGILSPYLFNVYVDELSEQLKMCNVCVMLDVASMVILLIT